MTTGPVQDLFQNIDITESGLKRNFAMFSPQVIEAGTHADLLKMRGTYHQVYMQQNLEEGVFCNIFRLKTITIMFFSCGVLKRVPSDRTPSQSKVYYISSLSSQLKSNTNSY